MVTRDHQGAREDSFLHRESCGSGVAGGSRPRGAADLRILGNQIWQSNENHGDGRPMTGWIRTPAQRHLADATRRPGQTRWPSGAGGAGSSPAGGAKCFRWSVLVSGALGWLAETIIGLLRTATLRGIISIHEGQGETQLRGGGYKRSDERKWHTLS
jgi:hypothetical protein